MQETLEAVKNYLSVPDIPDDFDVNDPNEIARVAKAMAASMGIDQARLPELFAQLGLVMQIF